MSDHPSEPGSQTAFALGPPGEELSVSLERVGQLDGVQWAHEPSVLPECLHYLDLFEQLVDGSVPCLVVYSEASDWESAVRPWISADHQIQGTLLGMMVFDGSFKFADVDFERIAIGYPFRGMAMFIVSHRLHTIPCLSFHNFPMEVGALREAVTSKPAQAEFPMEIWAVLCNQIEYIAVMLSPEVPVTTKVLTTYLQLFPKLWDQTPSGIVQYPYSTFSSRYELDYEGIDDLSKHEKTVHYHALTLIFSLCPAYSRNDRLGVHLLERYKSAKQSVNMTVMSEPDFMTVFNKCGTLIEDLPREVLHVIGCAVSITKHNRINPKVLVKDLLSAHDAVKLLRGSRWACGVYTQVRLVYQRHHLTLLDLAARAMRLILAHGLIFDADFNAEKDALLHAVSLAKDRPYIGLQGLKELQIANFPFWAVVGADYHAATLTGKDLDEWKKFTTDVLVKDLAYPYQRDMAAKMAQSIPSPFMVNAIRAAKNDDTIELNRALALLPPNSEEIVYATLAKDPDPGPWYLRKMNERYKKFAKEIKDIILDHVKPDIAQFNESIETQIENATNPRTKELLRLYRNKKTEERNAALAKFEAQTSQIPVPAEACMKELVTFGRERITELKKSTNDADLPIEDADDSN